MRKCLLTLAVLLLVATAASAQGQTGQIFGKVVDSSGGVLPGVNVTASSPVLLQPLVAVTSETGTYQFPQIPIGVYSVKFELQGFRTVVREDIRIEIGFNAQVNATLAVGQLAETVQVTGESPIVDTRDTTRTARFTQEALQAIPSARDPWVIIEQSPGVAMDRQNVGGSASGQQSNFVARGAATSQQSWNLDGVDITDMSATGGSPNYYDFDAFEEMQITMGGADISMRTPGVGVNLVTKTGTDRLRGSTRFYITDDKFESSNLTDAVRKQGATTGNPILSIRDYGIEAGGPIKKSRAWFWGSYGKQKVDAGINGFFKGDANCQAIKTALRTDALAYSVADIRGCLNADTTLLNNYNAKTQVAFSDANQFSFYYNAAEKVRNARDASDTRPIETTYRQMGVDNSALGSRWWKTGMPKTYKFSDRHVFGDKLMMELSYSHVGNNFVLTFHEDSLRDTQPAYDIANGAWARSYTESVYVRPTDSLDWTGNYFKPGVLGGDHAIKWGVKYRNDVAHSEGHWGGNAVARFTNFASMTASQAQLYRDSLTEYQLFNRSAYLQDTFTLRRVVFNVGVRWDYQSDEAHKAVVNAHPFYGQPTYAGIYNNVTYTGKVFDQLPTLTFPGAKAAGDKGMSLQNFSPVAALTYDLTDDGQNVLKGSYRRYISQIGTGALSSTYNTVGTVWLRYPWIDVNSDKFVQANEVVYTATPLTWSGNYDYRNPTLATSTGTNDPNASASKTDEVLLSFDRQIARDFAVSAAYIWRKYTNFFWSDSRFDDGSDFGSQHYTPVDFTPTGCPSDSNRFEPGRCETVTYYNPTLTIPTAYVYTNLPDYWRGYQGFELTVRKRMSKRWMMNGGVSFNSTPVHYDSPAAYEDPTNIERLNGAQYAPQSTTSGLDNVFINQRWIFRLSGAYTFPYDINLAAFYNTHDGNPFPQTVQGPSRINGAGIPSLYLDDLGDNRLPAFQQFDLRVSKKLKLINRLNFEATMDVFNVFNTNTALALRATQNASVANQIQTIVAPRIARFGVRATW